MSVPMSTPCFATLRGTSLLLANLAIVFVALFFRDHSALLGYRKLEAIRMSFKVHKVISCNSDCSTVIVSCYEIRDIVDMLEEFNFVMISAQVCDHPDSVYSG